MNTRTAHIAIEAHVDGDELRGEIRDDAGPARAFTGWLGLISTLDAILSPRVEGGLLEGSGEAQERHADER
ncbi:MAG: hypothetical protein ACXVSL_16265 [Solirubrobacteraceae bacterium]